MSTLDDAKVYLDLPRNMQDDDALRFARAVITLYEIVDRLKGPPFEDEQVQHNRRFPGCCNRWQVGQSGPCVLEPCHDGECIGRTGTAMGG